MVTRAGHATVMSLLLVGLTRWHVERCFEDGKSELGFDHWEGRSYLGLKRHQTVSAVSFLLLADTRRALGGEKPGMDGVPSSDGGGRVGGGIGVGVEGIGNHRNGRFCRTGVGDHFVGRFWFAPSPATGRTHCNPRRF